MSDLHINLWAVLLAAVSSMVIGAIYYSPALFGKMWLKHGKVDQKRFDKERGRLMPLMFLVALVTAYFVAYVSFLYHAFYLDSWLGASVATSFLLFVGFSATTVIAHGALDQRPRQLTYLTLGNRFLSFLAMGLILGWLHP